MRVIDAEDVYARMPIALQNVACGIKGWLIACSRYSHVFRRHLAAAEERTWLNKLELQEHRDARVRMFVRHAAETVPYYRECFRELRLDPADIRGLADLTALPVLSKDEVKRNLPSLKSAVVPKWDRVTGHTSGTTGSGLRFVTTREAVAEQWAIWWRYRGWHGIMPGTWCGYFGGRAIVPAQATAPPFWRRNRAGRQILFSGYHMSSENLAAYLTELRRSRPPWLHGYPSLLALLSRHILDERFDLGYEPRWVTTGAENLLPGQAAAIQAAFGVRPRQHYGMAEAAANVSECELGGLHVDEDVCALELLRGPNGEARVIGCNLSNLAMPLLRYDVGDTVSGLSTCACGRGSRVVESLDGRAEDYVVLPDGTRTGRLDHIFKDMVRIREAQIWQTVPGKVTVRVVRAAGYDSRDEAKLLSAARRRLGPQTVIELEYVGFLRRSATGKLRFVVSELREGQLAGEHCGITRTSASAEKQARPGYT
jgi:phenylacetate-CoA ligase